MTLAYLSETHAITPVITGLMGRMGVRLTFAKGEEIFGQEEDADMIYFLVSGAVRTTRLLADGRRQIGNFYYPQELVALETGPTHRFGADALIDSVLQVLKRSSLRAVNADGELDRAIWEATRRELERTQDHVMVLGRKTACEKVATFLNDLARRHDDEDVDVPMRRQDMADYLGLTIETVCRMVTQLQEAEIVKFAGSRTFRVKRWDELAQLAA
jgi:CRP/FNR family nitrogen fixation transcriptional regulator